jgi:hypothetical protein
MAIGVGSAEYVSTWGKFRCAYAKNARATTATAHSVEYASGLKAAASGSGLLRHIAKSSPSAYFYQPLFSNFYSPPFEEDRNALLLQGSTLYSSTVEFEAQLVGETVNLTGGSMVINSDLFTAGGFQNYADGSTDYGTITAIGKLTAF